MLELATASTKTEAISYNNPYTVWNAKDKRFYMYKSIDELNLAVSFPSRSYLHAVILDDKPIKPFFDLDIEADNDVDGKVAEDVFNRIMMVSTYILECLGVPDEYVYYEEYPDCVAIATDHRPGKFSYAIYYKYIHFKNRECLKSFYSKVEEELVDRGYDDCLKYFDKPSSNFRLVGCYKDDHKREWQTKDESLQSCLPHILHHNSYLVEIEEPESIKADIIDITDETEKQVLDICNEDGYLSENFTYTGTRYNNFQFKRIQSAYCDLCETKHDSQNAFVVVQGDTVYRKCYQDNTNSIRIGKLKPTIPEDLLNAFIDDDEETVIQLPRAEPEHALKLNYYSDAQYLHGKDWDAETIHNWFKKCVIKVRRTGKPAWVYIDRNDDKDSLKINLLESIPWNNKSESRKVKIDGKDYDLAKYLCDFSNMPGNSYDDVITYPYLFDTDKPNKPDKINLFPGFPFKHISDSKDIPHHWIEHIKLIDNGSEVLLDWIAHMVQKPFQKSFAVFMMGKKGTGKSLIYDMVCRMLGKALTLQLSDINNICGSFNDPLLNKLFVNLNETTHLTKQHENILKSLITETQLLINAKNQAAYTVDNYARYMITTNEKFGMRVTRDDRRGYYIETPEHQKNIDGYFEKMAEDVNNKNDEPFRLLFNYFANRDISGFKYKIPPMTKFKRELMSQSEDPIVNYLNEFVEGDRIANFSDGINYTFKESTKEYYISQKALYNDFKMYIDEEGEHRSNIKSNRIFKTKLEQLGITHERHRFEFNRLNCSIINIQHVKSKLKQ